MAVVMPFVGYGVYKLIANRTSLTSGRRVLAAGAGGYVGINIAALCAAIEFGLQPTLFHTANGTPLYAPFSLAQTIPAMLIAHLTVAGAAEAIICAGVVAYLQRANVPVLRINAPGVPVSDEELSRRKPLGWRWVLVGMAAMVVLTPIGLLAPGGAFGEDSPGALDLGKYNLRAVPAGLNGFSSFWSHAVLGGYGFQDGQHPVIGYILSAFVGILIVGALVLGIVLLIGRLSRDGDDNHGDDDQREDDLQRMQA
jgi:cobalt/nickel transport system permease protein